MVLSRDTLGGTGQTVAKQVLSTSVRNVEGTLLLTFAGGATIEATGNHPFFVEGMGFVPADQLGIGSQIVTRAGPNLVVQSIEKKTGTVAVYNFIVEDFHSYFVGNPDLTGGGAWVHNGADDCSQVEKDAIKAIENNMNEHLKEGPDGDIAAALKDTIGKPIVKGSKVYDHLDEVSKGYNGLIKRSKSLYGSTHPEAVAARSRAMKMVRKLESLFAPRELGRSPFRGD